MYFFSAIELQTSFKKPLCDLQKSIKYIKLNNGLKTLLISDPQAPTFAASVCVGSGSHSDPDELPGLAHFCEHVMFLGTDEYPSPNEFWSKLNIMAGSSNAYTMANQTCFYFEVPLTDTSIEGEFGLTYLIKIFSSFFKSLSFNERLMNLEVNSVDEEHWGNITNNEKILYHGMRLLSNEQHPFHRFATGNKQTLSSKKVRSEMLRYFNENYVSENMVLVLKSSLSLNQLQKMAIANFTSIPSERRIMRHSMKSHKKDSLSIGSRSSSSRTSSKSLRSSELLSTEFGFGNEIFPQESANQTLWIRQQGQRKARFIFPIYCFQDTFFENVWCSLLGDESLNSLFYFLKYNLQIIESMYVFTQSLSYGNKVLLIDVDYRKKFSSNLFINIIANFIEQLLNKDEDYIERMLCEYSRVFKFQAYFNSPNSSAAEEVCNYSQSIQSGGGGGGGGVADVDDLLIGDSFKYSKGGAQLFLTKTSEIFNTSNIHTIFLADDDDYYTLDLGRKIPQSAFCKDPFYNFEYVIFESTSASVTMIFPLYSFLLDNKYVNYTSQELDAMIKDSVTAVKAYPEFTQDTTPKLIDYSEHNEIWHSKTNTAKITVSFSISLSNYQDITRSSVAMEIIAEHIGRILNTEFYHGEFAFFSWGIFANYLFRPSLTFEVSGLEAGFGEFLSDFVKRVKELISRFNPNYKEFSRCVFEVRRSYDNLQNGDINKKMIAGSTMFLEEGVVDIEERFEALELITKDDTKDICNEINIGCKRSFIFISSMSEANAMKISQTINSITSHQRIYLQRNIFERRPASILLKPGRNDVVTMSDNNEDNNAVYYYIQMCQRIDKYTTAVVEFLAYLLSQDSSYMLRTKRQIGYVAFSGVRINKQTLGLYILLNSKSYSSSQIIAEIENMLMEWEERIVHMSQEDLSDHILSYTKSREKQENENSAIPSNISIITNPNKHSHNRVENKVHQVYWECILTNNHDDFSLDKKLQLQYLREWDLDIIVGFMKRHISVKSRSRAVLTISIISEKKAMMMMMKKQKKKKKKKNNNNNNVPAPKYSNKMSCLITKLQTLALD
ncbi:AXL1 [Candida oxycetoniae]|uniref:AXL1 n=1 Tax=Candida oxycetoniae TaxID=497107 RepID=A0AAI9T1S7_9ASCO|nr:AXL1 [Candida oxycetoniae]KAI3406935.2 AXL1 [Candida oxycetoniae]